jgi:hypothetical protein
MIILKVNKSYIVFFTLLIILILIAFYAESSSRHVLEERGGRVKVVKYDDGTWQILVDKKAYFIKGVMFTPAKIGESPNESTMRDWMYYDDNTNGLNDIAFETWLDKNNNNKKDADEKVYGDFLLLKRMGCNTIRLYHSASDNPILDDIYKTNLSSKIQYDHPINKELLRKLYNDYGIMVIMGHFLGEWTIGTNLAWESEGVDYSNPEHREQLKRSVKAMVIDNKDEPYVLFWLLGNENNIAHWAKCNAATKRVDYAKFIGELAEMIKDIDPEHPVAVCDGDNFNITTYYAKYAQEIDIIGYNSYRGEDGYGSLWRTSKMKFDRPVFISESGMFAYDSRKGEDEELQLTHIKAYWKDVVLNSADYYKRGSRYSGNSIGMIVFDWLDRWYMDEDPYKHNPGKRPWKSPDGLDHEEYFGIMSMGDGSDSLMRQARKAAYYLRDVWNKKELRY